MTEKEGCYLAH